MNVAVKYCGGCNPRYDRVALAEKLRCEFPRINVTDADIQDPDFIVVLCGCKSRCADNNGLLCAKGKVVVDSPENYSSLKETIDKELSK